MFWPTNHFQWHYLTINVFFFSLQHHYKKYLHALFCLHALFYGLWLKLNYRFAWHFVFTLTTNWSKACVLVTLHTVMWLSNQVWQSGHLSKAPNLHWANRAGKTQTPNQYLPAPDWLLMTTCYVAALDPYSLFHWISKNSEGCGCHRNYVWFGRLSHYA